MVLTKIDTCSSWHRKSLSLFFQCSKWREVEHEEDSTVLIHFRQREKVIVWPLWQVAWPSGLVSQQSIDRHKQFFILSAAVWILQHKYSLFSKSFIYNAFFSINPSNTWYCYYFESNLNLQVLILTKKHLAFGPWPILWKLWKALFWC